MLAGSKDKMVIPMHYEPDYSRMPLPFLTKPPEWLPRLEKFGHSHSILDLGAGVRA
jgi:hypothetical protein